MKQVNLPNFLSQPSLTQKQGCGSAPCLCPFTVATNGANDENDVNSKDEIPPHITLLSGKEPDRWWQLLLLLPPLLMQQKNKKKEEAKIKRQKKEKGGWTL